MQDQELTRDAEGPQVRPQKVAIKLRRGNSDISEVVECDIRKYHEFIAKY